MSRKSTKVEPTTPALQQDLENRAKIGELQAELERIGGERAELETLVESRMTAKVSGEAEYLETDHEKDQLSLGEIERAIGRAELELKARRERQLELRDAVADARFNDHLLPQLVLSKGGEAKVHEDLISTAKAFLAAIGRAEEFFGTHEAMIMQAEANESDFKTADRISVRASLPADVRLSPRPGVILGHLKSLGRLPFKKKIERFIRWWEVDVPAQKAALEEQEAKTEKVQAEQVEHEAAVAAANETGELLSHQIDMLRAACASRNLQDWVVDVLVAWRPSLRLAQYQHFIDELRDTAGSRRPQTPDELKPFIANGLGKSVSAGIRFGNGWVDNTEGLQYSPGGRKRTKRLDSRTGALV